VQLGFGPALELVGRTSHLQEVHDAFYCAGVTQQVQGQGHHAVLMKAHESIFQSLAERRKEAKIERKVEKREGEYSYEKDTEFSVDPVDPCWIDCLKDRAEAALVGPKFHSFVPWKEGTDIDYHLPRRIAVVGDIGVQNQYMKETIQAIVDKNPDLIIHLGDIYLVEGPRSAKNSPLFYRRLLETCPWSLFLEITSTSLTVKAISRC